MADDPYLAGMEADAEMRGANSAHAFEASSVLKVLEYAGVHPPRHLKRDNEFGFGWLRENYPSFPVYLEASYKNPIDLIDVFEAFTKTKPWLELMAILDNYGAREAGVVVKATAGQRKMPGLWVVHNAWSISPAPGQPRLIYRALAVDQGVMVERLESFMSSLKRHGWAP